MSEIFDINDNQTLIDEWGVDCYYYQARLSPDMINGVHKLDSDAIHGFRYNPPVAEKIVRQNVTQRIISSPGGKIFDGGAKFTIFPSFYDDRDEEQRSIVYERIFYGDVIVVRKKPMRDFDVLRKGKRDRIFAFDIHSILSISSIGLDKQETIYRYGYDYIVQVNGVALIAVISGDSIQLKSPDPQPVISDVDIQWMPNGNHPADEQEYAVEFTCSPNYVVWPDLARTRGTSDGDLPKTMMAAKRAWFNRATNPIIEAETQQSILDSYPISQDISFR